MQSRRYGSYTCFELPPHNGCFTTPHSVTHPATVLIICRLCVRALDAWAAWILHPQAEPSFDEETPAASTESLRRASFFCAAALAWHLAGASDNPKECASMLSVMELDSE